ncbi:MAG: type II toxin-antitoxin system RelE/ParE family toxin [Bifidobacteriaceae bacterium]|jgi:phage-related protein|nr:type II toxin-antitoxin system RelE/ParE family toxin [Bifidobacteriaceae bacterium]
MGLPEFDWIRRPDGSSEFEDFLDSLPHKDAAKLLAVIDAVECHGLAVGARMEWIKKLEGDLFELRSRTGKNSQRAIYFHEEAGAYIITHGFTKKSRKTPPGEIRHARQVRAGYWRDRKRGSDS